MTTTTVDLAAWLTAIWDEEERLAKDAHYEGQVWLPEEESVITAPGWDVVYTADRKVDARHIAEWSPASVLARIAADRKILELHRPERPPWSTMQAPGCRTCGTAQAWDDKAQQANCGTLRLLASPHKGREGWQEAWIV